MSVSDLLRSHRLTTHPLAHDLLTRGLCTPRDYEPRDVVTAMISFGAIVVAFNMSQTVAP
ncbi:hypothetical protein PG987_002442 [Apiospora arundinis]